MLLKVSSAFERGFATGFREKKKADQYFHLEITSFGAKTGDLGGKKTKKKNGLIEKKMTLNAVAATILPIVLTNQKPKINCKNNNYNDYYCYRSVSRLMSEPGCTGVVGEPPRCRYQLCVTYEHMVP